MPKRGLETIYHDEENFYEHFAANGKSMYSNKLNGNRNEALKEVNLNRRDRISKGVNAEGKSTRRPQNTTKTECMPPDFSSPIYDINNLGGEDFTHYNEYVTEMCRYLFTLERVHAINPDYMLTQDEITPKMRSIVVDWLVQVQNRFRMMPETLQLTVRIMDYYISLVNIPRKHLQLVAIASMMISSKYEEMVYPEVRDFVYVTNGAYKEDEIRNMELKILQRFNFFVGFPIPLHFLRRFSKAIGATSRVHKMARYFLEIALLDSNLASCQPSLLASSALNLAGKLLKECSWNDRVTYHSTYTELDLEPYEAKIAKTIRENEASTLRSTFRKYADRHNECISIHKIFESSIFKQL